jgi:3-hydroxy-9,10-secoandrosta-1,3,5(10)-triene-9,17-dione monooxygenase reductase component
MSNAADFDPREYRNALGNFATGVTVVTAKDRSEGYVGTTINSFSSVSIDPPLILWSLDKRSRSLAAYQDAKYFVVNVLAADQVTLSNEFAQVGGDKFSEVDYVLNSQGVPVLGGCVAHFECQTRHTYEGGDHIIIVGEVLHFDSSGRNALLFHKGGYCVSEYHPVASSKRDLPEDGSFADDYLNYLVGRVFYQLRNKLKPVLRKHRITDPEYRVLATMAGREDCSFSVLLHYTLLNESRLQSAVQVLAERGLVTISREGEAYFENTGVVLTDAGREMAIPLLEVARANEADALGNFNQREAREIKEYLKRMVAWTG